MQSNTTNKRYPGKRFQKGDLLEARVHIHYHSIGSFFIFLDYKGHEGIYFFSLETQEVFPLWANHSEMSSWFINHSNVARDTTR